MKQKQWVKEVEDRLRTALGQHADIKVRLRTTGQPLKVGCPVLMSCPKFGVDYSELSEKQFIFILGEIDDLSTLEGLANRRRWLSAPELPKWNHWQRAAILTRKYELQRKAKR